MATFHRDVGLFSDSLAIDLASARSRFDSCQKGDEGLIERRRVFRGRASLAIREFDSLKAKFARWNEKISNEQEMLEQATEVAFKSVFFAWVRLADFLVDKWDEYSRLDVRLDRHRFVTRLRNRRNEASRILAKWDSMIVDFDENWATD